MGAGAQAKALQVIARGGRSWRRSRDTLLGDLLPRLQVNIPPMSREDLRSAVETPAKKAGLTFVPPELVDRILDDVGLEEGRFPLLQFATSVLQISDPAKRERLSAVIERIKAG